MPKRIRVRPANTPAVCAGCGCHFMAVDYEVKRGNGRFCKRDCQRSHQARINAEEMARRSVPKSQAQRRKEWLERVGPEVLSAHKKTEWAIASGKLVRQPCEKCGATKVDAHHDDYSRPLDVRWLCRSHHLEHHRAGK